MTAIELTKTAVKTTTAIELANGGKTYVDPVDYERLKGYTWRLSSHGYAYRTEQGAGRVYLHREVMGYPKAHVDHVNGDRLDNRKANLRAATHRQNQHNAKKRGGTASRFKGVSFYAGKWVARITVDRRNKYLGCFDDENEAAHAYDVAAREQFGAYARLNNPGRLPQPKGVRPSLHLN